MLDVVIIGAGQSGLVLGHALKRRGVTNILLLDRNPAGYEGVWETYARNYEIRSPKDITGSDLGIPSLSIQSFYEAKHGPDAWAAIKRVPRVDWMDYLRWYKTIADVPIENGVEVTDIDYDKNGVTLTTEDGSSLRARYAVLATGMDGGGAWSVPSFIADNLPRDRYNHSADIFDAEKLRDRRVGVLGAGAACCALALGGWLVSRVKSIDAFVAKSRREVCKEP